MAKRQKVQEVAQDVQEVRQTIDNALNEGVTFQFKGADMNNEDVVPAATETDAERPAEAATPQAAPEVEVVVQRDSTPAEQQAQAAREQEDEGNLSDIEKLRQYSADELKERGVPASSIPRNAANTEPDLDPEKARELERRAAASPNFSYVEGSTDDGGTEGEGGGEAVG
jgi:hypothetical protein